jgi:hypothetical protein
MQVIHQEKVKDPKHPTCDICIGRSSWDPNEVSLKFAWYDKQGKRCRGGEVPLGAIEQMQEVAQTYGPVLIKMVADKGSGK